MITDGGGGEVLGYWSSYTMPVESCIPLFDGHGIAIEIGLMDIYELILMQIATLRIQVFLRLGYFGG